MNPPLAATSLAQVGDYWKPVLESIPKSISKDERTVEILKRLTQKCAGMMKDIYIIQCGTAVVKRAYSILC